MFLTLCFLHELGLFSPNIETKPQLSFAASVLKDVTNFWTKYLSTIWSILLWETGFSNFYGNITLAVKLAETAGNRYLRRFLPGPAGNFTCETVYLWPSQIILHAPVLMCRLEFEWAQSHFITSRKKLNSNKRPVSIFWWCFFPDSRLLFLTLGKFNGFFCYYFNAFMKIRLKRLQKALFYKIMKVFPISMFLEVTIRNPWNE